MDVFNSLTDKILPENCKKSLASVQEKFKPGQYKKSLSSITFQNKVALRRSLKSAHMTLGECIDCEKDLDPLPANYTGPTLAPGDSLSVDFVRQLSSWFSCNATLPLKTLYRLLQLAEKSLRLHPNSVQEISLSPDQCVHVCGDVHGQFKDLLNIFHLKGDPSDDNMYLFNGDIVDRGPASLQCIVLLLAWHAASPRSVHINRGNHEAINMNMKDGFHKELMEKYNDNILFDFFQEIFSWLPVATLVSDKVLILHGGLSSIPGLELDDIRRIPRGNSFQPDDSDLLCDLLWSDPMQIGMGIRESSRGGGVLFGSDVTATFLHNNSLQCLVRSHSEIKEGCACSHPGCYTVFSAPSRSRNIYGGVLTLHPTDTQHLRMEGFVFQEVIQKH
eukprot:TRINITY_DN33998_c0_g1_i2.p1 TRINITY_DN33998_c0_g1~~TRINITY_DN33998_c0_g1_i2.p1  ORF type:complete len:389 (-),score=69.93 TRINITY_DN33998_c0_g1_i2:60-1226(-)